MPDELLGIAFDASPAAMAIVRLSDNVCVAANEANQATFGYRRDELVGLPADINQFLSKDQLRRVATLHRAQGFCENEVFEVRKRDGTPVTILYSSKLAVIDGERYALATFHDVTRRVEAERELLAMNRRLAEARIQALELAAQAEASAQAAAFLAAHDSLTGALSRRAWFEAAAASDTEAVAIFDVDHFKRVNDRVGHPAGDEVLAQVSRRLGDSLGEKAIVGRIGGEEFAAAFGLPLPGAEMLCARALDHVSSRPVRLLDGRAVPVTVSAGLGGLASGGSDAESISHAYEAADRALYEAKTAGRARLVVNRPMAA